MYSISKTDGRQGTKGAKLNRYKPEFSQKQHNKTAVTYCKYPPNGLLSIIMENRMNAIAEVLEQELEGAFEVKDKKSLHRYIVLLTENIVKKENYENRQSEIKSDIKILAESLKQGF